VEMGDDVLRHGSISLALLASALPAPGARNIAGEAGDS